jgi:uncharacterized protein (TIGR03067 family)
MKPFRAESEPARRVAREIDFFTAVVLTTILAVGGIGLYTHSSGAPAGQQRAKKDESATPGGTKKEGADQPATDVRRLRGTWVLEQVERGGDKHQPQFPDTITFTDNKVAWLQKTMLRDGTFTLDTMKDPRQIDWILGEFVPVRIPGIYRLEGDTLILSMGPDNHYSHDSRRPKSFSTKAKDPHWVYTLKRPTAEAKDEPQGEAAKLKAARLRCSNTMHQVMLAMHNYHDAHGHFPHPAVCDKEGHPLLSWRVALLPQLGYGELHKQFKLDEPWDSENNKKLLAKIPKVYASLGAAPKVEHGTFYQVFVGNGAAFEEKTDVTFMDITDGTSGTIFLVEAWDAVPWTKPADLAYDPTKELPMFGGMLGDGLFTFVLGDGSAHTTKNVVDAKAMHALITRNGGELVNLEDLDR